jgi:hypothetical protein
LLVLDIDGDDGRDTLRSLERKHGPLPHTPQVLTPNGEHYYFGSSDKFKNQVKFAPGLDIRSSGGYVLGPPSIQKSGKVYVWDIARRIDETPIAMPPAWLVELLSKSTEKNNVRRDWKTVPFANTPIGSRNQTLVSLTGHLLRKHVDEQIAYTLLLAWNKCCTQEPLPIEEFEKTVNGIAKMEFERRKSEGRL